MEGDKVQYIGIILQGTILMEKMIIMVIIIFSLS